MNNQNIIIETVAAYKAGEITASQGMDIVSALVIGISSITKKSAINRAYEDFLFARKQADIDVIHQKIVEATCRPKRGGRRSKCTK